MTADPPARLLGSLGWRLFAAFALVALGAVGLVTAAALIGTGRGLEEAAEADRGLVAVRVADAAADAYAAAGSWESADLSEVEAIAAAAGATVVIVAADGSVVREVSAGAPWPTGGAQTVLLAALDLADGTPSPDGRSPGGGPASGPSAPSPGGGSLAPPGIGSGSPNPTAPTVAPGGSPAGSPGGSPGGSGGGSPSSEPSAAPSPAPDTTPSVTGAEPQATATVLVSGLPVGVVGLVFEADEATTARDIAWRWVAVAACAALLLALAMGLWVTRRLAAPLMAVAGAARAFTAGDKGARTGVTGPGEVGDVARSVDEMADTVVRSEESRRRLASNVAHELRTPLAALQAGLEEVRDGLVEPDAELLAGLHDQSLRLGRIVDDLAALSAAEASALSLRWADVDLAALARSETAAQEPRLRAAGLTVTVTAGAPVMVRGDADRLRQVLANLLSNTARYCRAGDEVFVTVAADAELARLCVRDTGPGIPADECPHVFERFWRGTAGDRAQGSGLGLSVVRELVSAHRGLVRVDSDGRSGTSFEVVLPRGDGAA